MDHSEFFVNVKEFPHITDEEISAFASHMLSVAANPSPQLMDSLSFYFESRLQEGIPIVPEKEFQDQTPFDFYPIQFKHIPDLHKFPFLEEVLHGVDFARKAVLIFKNGRILYPHTDRSYRTHVVNFPILNACSSKTCFYEIEDPSLEFRPSWCYTSGIKKVAEMQYGPRSLNAFCVQQIHAVEAVNDDPRIVLSASIDGNVNFADVLAKLKK